MVLMVEKGIGGGIYHFIYQYAKAQNRHIKDYDKSKESHLQNWYVNNLHGWVMSHAMLMFNILKNYMNFTMTYHFYLKE